VNDRAVLVAILIYITLDLSVAAMPGAFVFETADSVESSQSRGRRTTETVMVSVSAPRRESVVLPQPGPLPGHGVIAGTPTDLAWEPFVRRLPRSRDDDRRPSEDPH
jgi:hypothetical protein